METVQPWIGSARSVLTDDPFLAAFVAIILLVSICGLIWYVRDHRRSRAATFQTLLKKRDAVAVLMHPHPDPDAMACALGVKQIAEHVGTEATLHYTGEIRHQENRAFKTVLDLTFDRIETASDLSCDSVVLVDHNDPRGFNGSGGIDPVAVIDHHPGGGSRGAFTDVRPEYGACSSILAEYFEDLGAERYGSGTGGSVDSDALALSSTVATALVYGIQSDTKQLSKGCTLADFDAYSYLYPGIDEGLLDRIANPLVDAEVLEVKRRAIDQRECRVPYAISDVGGIDNLDAIPQAADELIRVDDSTAVVVMGHKEGTLHLSGRSRDDRLHIGQSLKTAVDDIPMANAGGHARMGGGQISIAHMEGIGPSDGLTRDELYDKLFRAMDGEE